MQQWKDLYVKILMKSEIKELMKGLYVDDGRIMHRPLRLGERYDPEKEMFEVKDDEKVKDEAAQRCRHEITRIEVQKAMNSVSPDLRFTMELCKDFEGGRLPTLSFSLWQEEDGLKHTYFEKCMRNQILLVERTSMSRQSLMSILRHIVTLRFGG